MEKKVAKAARGSKLNRRDFLAGSGRATVAGGLVGGPIAAARTPATDRAAGQTRTPAVVDPPRMMRSELASERIQRIDPQTGIRVIQITSYPSPAAHFHYDWPSITPDNRRVVFFCQRYVGRGAPWDLFRCDTDGLNLFQLTRRGAHDEVGGYYGRPSAVLSLDGTTIYVVWNKLLCAVDVETGKIDELLPLQDVCPRESQVTRIALASAGRLLFIGYGGPAQGAVRVDLATAKFDRIDLQGQLFGCLQAEPRLVVQRGTVQWGTVAGTDGTRSVTHVGSELSLWNTDQDGGDGRFICPSIFAHATLLGKTSMVQGCARQPDHCIWLVEREGVEPKKLVEGPYFWHSGASFDGQWILADTDSPDQGLQLVHAPTGHFRTLCYAGATQDHVEFGHPHPALSQDGRVAVFRSDRTHASQVYVAHITDEFRERVQAGAPDAKR